MKRLELRRKVRSINVVETLEGRALLTMAATTPLPDVTFAAGVNVAPVNLDAHFNDPAPAANFAMFDTSLGTIPVLLTPATTPKTVANFENYVNKGSYTNTIVHRSVPGFIWQAGGFQLTSKPDIAPISSDAPVVNEFGASNTRGTIAMAKIGNNPNSATNQFFFNESDNNASNLDNQNGGFTVFGKVVGDAGLAVMDAVASVPVPSPPVFASPLDQIPLQNYTRGSSTQPSNLVLIKNVSLANDLFLASSDTPGVATATIQGDTLSVTPLATGTAKITVVGYGSDGKPATQTFSVNVSPTATLAPPPANNPPPVTNPPPVAATPPAVLTPTASRGALPNLATAGQKVKIQQVVTLKNATQTASPRERVAVVLSKTTTGSASDVAIAAAQLRLKAGGQARVKLVASRLSPKVPAGIYHVLVTVSDPNGARTTIDTGKTLTVLAPRAKVAGK